MGVYAVETAAAEARQFQATAAIQVMCSRSKSERRQRASTVAPTLAQTLGRWQGCNARRASPRVYPCTILRLRLGGEEADIRGTAAPTVQAIGRTVRRPGLVQVFRTCLVRATMWGLAQELAVEELDEDLPDAGLGEAVRPVHGDELAPNALELWQRHGRCWELQRPLDVRHGDLASPFACVVLLVGGDLGDDVGGGLVELVEVILLGCRFLNIHGQPQRLLSVIADVRITDVPALSPGAASRPLPSRRCQRGRPRPGRTTPSHLLAQR